MMTCNGHDVPTTREEVAIMTRECRISSGNVLGPTALWKDNKG